MDDDLGTSGPVYCQGQYDTKQASLVGKAMPSLHPKGRGGPKAFCTRGGFSPNPLALSYGEESTLHFVYDICHFLDISGY